jgi:crotonobetainyl-CoA:carnitine CoA-transferase CaiB-like acyl-CoA transferase
VLDLKTEEGRTVFYKLVEDADVVVQNYRPGVGERLEIDYDRLKKINPRLIYCRASGFGLKGPDAERPALDPLAQARGGVMSVTGEPDQPPTRTFGGFADQVSAFLLSYGIALALYHRERTGEGQMVDGSLLQGTLAVQAFNVTSYLMTRTYGGSPIPRISRKLTSPLWNHYKTQDNKWVMVGMPEIGRYWPIFRKALEEATGDIVGPDKMSVEWLRMNAVDLMALIPKVDEIFASKTAAYWKELFRKHDLLIEIVQEYADLATDPQVVENNMVTEFEHPTFGALQMVAPAVNLSETPGSVRTPAPEFSQHTEEVLLEAGYTWEEIEQLRSSGAIGHRSDSSEKSPT